MSQTDILNTMSLFSGLPENSLEKVEKIAVSIVYEKEREIFTAGTKAEGFYGVADGKVKIYRSSFSGKEQIIHILGPGEIFGEVPVFQGASFPASAMAMEKSELLYFPRKNFERIIKEDPELAMGMMGILSGRLRQLVNQVASLSLKEVPARLAGYLLLLQSTQDNNEITLELPKGQIASYLGTIQETLSRTFKKMAEAGIISTKGKTVAILDKERLDQLASGEESL